MTLPLDCVNHLKSELDFGLRYLNKFSIFSPFHVAQSSNWVHLCLSARSRRALAASWFAEAKSHLDTIPGLQLIPTKCVRSVAAVRITMQHISWSRSAAELAPWRFFGQMAFSRDMLLRRGSQIMSICFDTARWYSDAPDTRRPGVRAPRIARARARERTRQQRMPWLKMKICAFRWSEVKLVVAAVTLKWIKNFIQTLQFKWYYAERRPTGVM